MSTDGRFRPLGIFIGSPPTQEMVRWFGIRLFWTPASFWLRRTAPAMHKAHQGNGEQVGQSCSSWCLSQPWAYTVSSCRAWLDPSSPLHVRGDELSKLLACAAEGQMRWIRGDHDAAFPSADFMGNCALEGAGGMPNDALLTVKSGHFNYFSTAWPETQAAIVSALASMHLDSFAAMQSRQHGICDTSVAE